MDSLRKQILSSKKKPAFEPQGEDWVGNVKLTHFGIYKVTLNERITQTNDVGRTSKVEGCTNPFLIVTAMDSRNDGTKQVHLIGRQWLHLLHV